MSESSDGRHEQATKTDRESLRLFLTQTCDERFLARFGAHAAGIGRKLTSGRDAGSGLSLRLYVERKRHSGLGPLERIPVTVEVADPVTGATRIFSTDVVESAPLWLQNSQPLVGGSPPPPVPLTPPIRGGDSCSAADKKNANLGTLGGFAWDSHDEHIVMISNRHVLGAKRLSKIVSPGYGNDFSIEATQVGELKRASAKAPKGADRIDCAIGRPFPGWPDFDVPGIGPAVYAIETATEGLAVQMRTWTELSQDGVTVRAKKVGDGEVRRGQVDDIGYQTWLMDDETGEKRWIYDCLRVIPAGGSPKWSLPGDSGSLVFSSAPVGDGSKIFPVVGLHFAGDVAEGIGYACKIQSVFEEMELEVLPAGAFRWFIEWMLDRGERRDAVLDLQDVADWSNPDDLSFFRRLRRNEVRGFRRYEKLKGTAKGGAMNRLLSARALLLSLLVNDRDVQRAVVNALEPMLTTEDDILLRPLSAADVQNLGQLAEVLIAKDPAKLETAVGPIAVIVRDAAGRTLAEVLNS